MSFLRTVSNISDAQHVLRTTGDMRTEDRDKVQRVPEAESIAHVARRSHAVAGIKGTHGGAVVLGDRA